MKTKVKPKPLTPAQAKLYERLAYEGGTMGIQVPLEIWPDETRQAKGLEKLGIIKFMPQRLKVKLTQKGLYYFA